MKNINDVVSEKTMYSIKDYSGGKINSVDVVERLSPNCQDYIYLEKYQGNDGVAFIGASAQLKKDEEGNIVPEKVNTGIWFYDDRFMQCVGNAKEFLYSVVNEYDPIESLSSYNMSLYQEQGISPSFYMQAKVVKIDGNLGYDVQARLNQNKIVDLFFRYNASVDFRSQIQNLYKSLIRTKDVERDVLDLTGISSKIRSCEVGAFDFEKYYQGLKSIREKTIDIKEKKKV